MKTSAIRHPEGSYFIIRRDWTLKACEIEQKGPKRGNAVECAAEIMAVLEFHFNNRHANRIYKELVDKALAKRHNPLTELGDWLPYSNDYFRELLLRGRSQNVVIQALEILESKGFITTNVPEDILNHYSRNFTWYKLEVDKINEWIDNNVPKTWIDGWKKKRGKISRNPVELEARKAEDAAEPKETVTKTVNTIFEFYKHIHGKNSNFVFDQDRRNRITARIKEGRTIEQCAQAVIGNLFSDWHQARHPKNMLGVQGEQGIGKVYDDIDHIFGDAKSTKRFENHIGYAEDARVTEEIAFRELQAFLEGKPSRYAKQRVKTPQNGQDEPESASKPLPNNHKQYREFAIAVAPFFTTNVPAVEIVEYAQTQESMIRAGAGLVDAEYLTEAITKATRTFRESLTPEMEKELADFVKTFCQIQQLNSDES